MSLKMKIADSIMMSQGQRMITWPMLDDQG